MRKRLFAKIYKSRTGRKSFIVAVLLVIFVLTNIYFVYHDDYNDTNGYISFVREVIPFPAFVIGNDIITISEYTREIDLNRRIQKNVYKIDAVDNGDRLLWTELKDRVKKDITNRAIMERILEGTGVAGVGARDINQEYEKIVNEVGGRSYLSDILKASAGWSEDDMKSKIYDMLLAGRIADNFICRVKLDILSVRQSNETEDGERISSLYNELKSGAISFEELASLIGDDSQVLPGTIDGYYFFSDLPEVIRSYLSGMVSGQVSPLITDSGRSYLFRLVDKKGYYYGSLESFIDEQKNNIRILSFVQ